MDQDGYDDPDLNQFNPFHEQDVEEVPDQALNPDFNVAQLIQDAIDYGPQALGVLSISLTVARQLGYEIPGAEGLEEYVPYLPVPDYVSREGLASLIGLYANIYGLTLFPVTVPSAGMHAVGQLYNAYQNRVWPNIHQVTPPLGYLQGFLRWAGIAAGARAGGNVMPVLQAWANQYR